MMVQAKEMARKHLEELLQSRATLQYSFEKCHVLTIEPGMTFEELDAFEALTSRFARTSDLIIQKAFRTIDLIELEQDGTVRDRILRAEKRGLIQDPDLFMEIRLLRNVIAHEYRSETILEIFERVLSFTPHVISCIDALEFWLQDRLK